jgi:hypothetical protein
MRAIHIILTVLFIVFVIFSVYVIYKHQYKITYTETAVCVEKFPEFGETGLRGYVVILQYEDSRVEEKHLRVKEYSQYKLNQRYIFTRSKYMWR